MANDPKSGLTIAVIENPYLLDRFMAAYSQKRGEQSGGKTIYYPEG